MARAYSPDLREHVVAAVAAGASCRKVAPTFKVSVASVVKWSQQFRATGSATAQPMGGQRPYALAGERSWLLRRVAQQPDLTLRALLAELAERGIVVSYYAVSALLHPEMATFYREQVTALHSVLGDAEGADRAEAAERLRSLVSKIVLTPEDGRLAIDVHGDLAGILAIAPGKGPNGAAAQEPSQMQVTAARKAC